MSSEIKIGKKTNQTKISGLFRRYLTPQWRWVVLLIVCYFLVTLLTAFQPLVMAPVLDIVLRTAELDQNAVPALQDLKNLNLNNLGIFLLGWLGQFDLDQFQIVWVLGLVYLTISILLYSLNFGVYLIEVWIRINSERDIQRDLVKHIFSLSLDFFNRTRTGELLSRLDQDTRMSVASLAAIARNVVVSSGLVIIYTTLLVRTNTRLTTLIIIAGALHYGVTQLIRNPIKQRVRDQFNIFAETSAYLQEIISGVRVVKSFVAEKYEDSRFAAIIQRLLRINLRYGIYKNVDEPIGQIINSISNLAILLLAAQEFFRGGLSATGFFLYLFVGRSILGPITALTRSFTAAQTVIATSERVNELFDEQSSIVGGNKVVQNFEGLIRFDNVGFKYAKEKVLHDISFTIKHGEIVALVGPSGSGKSTLIDLLLRFYDPSLGQIKLDGTNIKEFELTSYRQLFGVVSQDSLLFNNTVAENIAYPGLEKNRFEIENAAKIANAHNFISQLPQGYDSFIGDRGVLLSGGQRQRIAIARAVVRKPQILLLDEATSSLDSESERLVQKAIDKVIRGTTAVVIAHRLSTVVHADRIVVIDKGQMVDSGKHEELFKRCELYRHLCELQFGIKKVDKGN